MDLLSKFHNKYDFRLFYDFVELFRFSPWKVLTHPEVVVPGEETVILLTKNGEQK